LRREHELTHLLTILGAYFLNSSTKTAILSAILATSAILITACANKPAERVATTEINTTTPVTSSKIEPKAGTKAKEVEPKSNTAEVAGINGYTGEVSGKPASNSKFKSLQIGMSMRQVMDLAGLPTDQGAYITGKAFIPFYFGGDRHRTEFAYKGSGRLIFASDSPWTGSYTGGSLIKILHDAKDTGYR
jgi:hypothetical protein